jgi:hypothetical protein
VATIPALSLLGVAARPAHRAFVGQRSFSDDARMPARMRRGLLGRLCFALNAAGALVFGLVVLLVPTPDAGYYRSIGVACIGMGLFGGVLAWRGLRFDARASWWSLAYFALFWAAHLILGLPPGKDHVHQVAFIVLALAGLALTWDEARPFGSTTAA